MNVQKICKLAWRRLWVRAIVFLPQGRGEPHFILQLCRKAQDDEPLKQVKASRDGLRLFRCRSGSRALRCWGVASGSTLLIYLAAATEQLTQEWMHALREGLWPTVSTNHDCYYDVSLIDDEKSSSSGLLGVYGRLVKTSEMTLSIIHPHWQGTQMRWRLTDILDVRIIRKVDDEDSDSGVFSLTVRSSANKDTRVLHFFSNTAFKAVDWLKSILPNVKSELKPKHTNSGENIHQEVTKLGKNNISVPNETANYATIQKANVNISSKNSTGIEEISSGTPNLELSNIPDSFLNASTNSLMIKQIEKDDNGPKNPSDEESDGSSTGSYDHIYEDLELAKDTRSFTVYEKVDGDDDDCYVPHLPFVPPILPERTDLNEAAGKSTDLHQLGGNDQDSLKQKQNLQPPTLRLQRLCESVSEALKQAEEPPTPASAAHKRPKFLQKMVGKSKSKNQNASPPAEKAPLSVQTSNASSIKRTLSESDLTDTKLEDNDLPLKPFNTQTASNASSQRHSPNASRKQNHVPLEDLLKNMKMGHRQNHHHHRRGVSDGGTIVYEIDKHARYVQIRREKKLSPGHSSDQLEAEYIDMT